MLVKMKKLFLFLFIGLFYIMGTASAGLLPYAVEGTLTANGKPLQFIQISLQNLDYSDDIIYATTDYQGHYLFTLGNKIDWYYNERRGIGDELQLIACNVNLDPTCQKNVFIGNEIPKAGGGAVNFDLKSNNVVIQQGEERVVSDTIYYYICSDGTQVTNPNLCEPIGEETDEWFWTTLSLLSAAFATAGLRWGKGFIALLKYWFVKDKARAKKMLKTAAQKWLWQK